MNGHILKKPITLFTMPSNLEYLGTRDTWEKSLLNPFEFGLHTLLVLRTQVNLNITLSFYHNPYYLY